MAHHPTTQDSYQSDDPSTSKEGNTVDHHRNHPQSINYSTNTAPSLTHPDESPSSYTKISNPVRPTINPNTISSTASHQHQQEQELLSEYTVPNPPISTKQSNAVAAEQQQDLIEGGGGGGDNGSTSEQPRTLWMGDLDSWLDEQQITDLWWNLLKKNVVVKIIRPKTLKLDPHLQGLTNSGYCFVEFETFEDAQEALSLNGQLLPDIAMPSQQLYPNNPDNQKKYFRLNWASGATLSAPIVQMPEFSLFVGDLSASTTEAHLLAFFQKKFPNSIKTVRVMTDPVSGKSRCFGFVRFTEELERQRALNEMNGVWFAGRPLRVALATPRSSNYRKNKPYYNNNSNNGNNHDRNDSFILSGAYYSPDPTTAVAAPIPPELMFIPPGAPQSQIGGSPIFGYYNPMANDRGTTGVQLPPDADSSFLLHDPQNEGQPYMSPTFPIPPHQPPQLQLPQYSDPNNTTVFVGGLSSEVTEATLFTLFKPFGVIQQIKIPPGKNCGFVKYSTREEAERTIAAMQGFIIGGNRVRLSWGRVSMNNKKYQRQQHQVAQAAQMQVAAALSMGMDPASAIAAAAAAAAGGYPPPPPPPSGGVIPQSHPHHQVPPPPPPPHILGPQVNIPPPSQGGSANASSSGAIPSMGMQFPAQQYAQYANYLPPQSSEEGESIDTSSTRAGVGTCESEPSYTSTPIKGDNNKDAADAAGRRGGGGGGGGHGADSAYLYGYRGEQLKEDEGLINSMNKMNLGKDNGPEE